MFRNLKFGKNILYKNFKEEMLWGIKWNVLKIMIINLSVI